MINSNKEIDKGIANGTLGRFKGIKLKNNNRDNVSYKNWDGYKVRTVSVEDVEYILCEHWEGKKDKNGIILPPKKFKLYAEKNSVQVTILLHGCKVNFTVQIQQFGLLVNIATTGHKLQGMSKDIIIVSDWDYRTSNWVYVVLSRVRTLSGLFLEKPLDSEKYFKTDRSLIEEEKRLLSIQDQTLENLMKKIHLCH